MELTIVGITVVDVVFPGVPRLPAWPRHTEFTPANLVLLPRAPLVTLGGNGANAAYVAARCGARVTLVSPVGTDGFGRLARGWLEEAGCRMVVPGRPLATAVNVTAANARQARATLFFAGESPRLGPQTRLPRGGALLLCGWPHPAPAEMAQAFARVRRHGGLTALDTGPILERPWTLAALASVWPSLDLLLTNEHELRTITREAGLPAALRRLRGRFSGDIVVKRGARGALWLPAGRSEGKAVPAPKVQVVNTVGAGDAFNGALLAALCAGRPMLSALRQASRVAAGVVASPRGVLGAAADR